MKQIRLKNKVIKIEECCKCPLCNDEYGECQLESPVVSYDANIFPESCPLEEYVEMKNK